MIKLRLLAIALASTFSLTAGSAAAETARDGSVLISIPAARFVMGSNASDDERPARWVAVHSFFIGRDLVTNAQFARFIEATHYNAGTVWKEQAALWGDKAPVVAVSPLDAAAYCQWAGLSLPTSEEWEYAARGRDGRFYPWGDTFEKSRCCNSYEQRRKGPEPVGSHAAGNSPFGCRDMAGSADQWTASWADAARDSRIFRGGSWKDNYEDFFRSTYRGRFKQKTDDGRDTRFGFRVARHKVSTPDTIQPRPTLTSPILLPEFGMSLILPKGWVAERFSLGHMSFTYGICQVSLYEKSPSIVETDLDFTFGINKKLPPKPRQGSHKGIKSTEYLGESKDLNGKPLTLYVGIFETNRPVVIKWNEDAKFLPQLRSIISSVRLLKSSEDT